ncbi:exodeoxyribonuclease V subunit beta [Alteromonas flava]|uniref:exodeoxyribonuclease V subunit beta n=1 Tax=Alteromonas flava TaxID=2048003 RepID=UPI000C28992B|nr:exodeoxyribonuclease V subunit beta [Alteromonas flava]
MTIAMSPKAKNLDVVALPLNGVHLIEASAGTGKTFNITRLYLRLIIECGYSVQQILVMTFTNAATQELRGRLTEALQHALSYWTSAHYRVEASDPVLEALYSSNEPAQAMQRIKVAVLEMDEAAVYTIHGFCQRMLKTLAFDAHNPFTVTLEQDHAHIVEQAVEDWFRILQRAPAKLNALSQQGWDSPASFKRAFEALLYRDQSINLVTAEQLKADHQARIALLQSQFQAQMAELHAHMLAHEAEICAALIKEPKHITERTREWEILLNWLSAGSIEEIPAEVGRFINGNRYRGNDVIKTLFEPLKNLRTSVMSSVASLNKKVQQRTDASTVFSEVLTGVTWIRERITQEKERLGEVGFDDLIKQMADGVARSPALASRLKQTYPVALVDEFQDTDAYQYAIFESVYVKSNAQSNSLLMMIGDPKQAIYGFRGGDIYTYLRARDSADHIWLMDTNWRSIAAMVKAYNQLFSGRAADSTQGSVFGAQISYQLVNATEQSAAAKKPFYDPLQTERGAINYIHASADDEATHGQQERHVKQSIAQWCSLEIQRLLRDAKREDKLLKPNDIAILVRNWREAEVMIKALRSQDINAVYLSDKTPLFSSQEAAEVLRLLEGIWYNQRDRYLLAALSTQLLSIPLTHLQEMQSDPLSPLWSELRVKLERLRSTWSDNGVLALLFAVLRNEYQPIANSERALTNYLHLAELLQQRELEHANPAQTILWLQQQIHQPDLSEAFQQRLESDAQLIQIVTQHKSKGLEYPIVFIPFANEYTDPTKVGNREKSILQYYDPKTDQRVCQLGVTLPAETLLQQQELEETVRLLYVAITRAEYRCYLGVVDIAGYHASALGRLLNITENPEVPWLPMLQHICNDAEMQSHLHFAHELPKHVESSHNPMDDAPLMLSTFTGQINTQWQLHSFSALTRLSHGADLTLREIEYVAAKTDSEEQQSKKQQAELAFRFRFAKGAQAGNFLHDVLEHTDFSHPDWSTVCAAADQQYALLRTAKHQAAMQEWLQEIMVTPIQLGQAGTTLTLSQLANAQTLREAEFYFPVAQVDPHQVSQILAQHRQQLVAQRLLPQDVNVNLVLGASRVLEGMMHGFIDLIFESAGRYYVCDYKSTHMGDNLDDYAPAALALNNLEHAYDLQYLIYAVALQRMLKNILPDYDFDRHFGGVAYLYLRGMHPDGKDQQGVFYHPLTKSTVDELDQLFTAHKETKGALC